MIILQSVPPTDIWKWLLLQPPIIVFLSVVAYYQWKLLREKDKTHAKLIEKKDLLHQEIIDKKDERNSQLADKALTVASLYDVKGDMNSVEHKKIIDLQEDIKDILKEIKNKFKT